MKNLRKIYNSRGDEIARVDTIQIAGVIEIDQEATCILFQSSSNKMVVRVPYEQVIKCLNKEF